MKQMIHFDLKCSRYYFIHSYEGLFYAKLFFHVTDFDLQTRTGNETKHIYTFLHIRFGRSVRGNGLKCTFIVFYDLNNDSKTRCLIFLPSLTAQESV